MIINYRGDLAGVRVFPTATLTQRREAATPQREEQSQFRLLKPVASHASLATLRLCVDSPQMLLELND